MPNALHRGEFINDAAQKLGIDSALLLQEVKMAAAQRTASIPSHRAEPITETERILLRALVLPESDPARVVASTHLAEHPEWIADLATADLLDALAHAPAPPNPLDAASTDEMRAHLAHALAEESHTHQPSAAPLTAQVEGALHNLEHRRLERRQRELRTQIAEADRRGDTDMLNNLIAEKVEIDRQLRSHYEQQVTSQLGRKQKHWHGEAGPRCNYQDVAIPACCGHLLRRAWLEEQIGRAMT